MIFYCDPQEEISREEYIRAYSEYMSNVRNRRLAEKSTIDALTQRERRKKFRKTVQFFDNLNKGKKSFKWYLSANFCFRFALLWNSHWQST